MYIVSVTKYAKKNWVFMTIGFLLRFFISVGDYHGDINNHIAWVKYMVKLEPVIFMNESYPITSGPLIPIT